MKRPRDDWRRHNKMVPVLPRRPAVCVLCDREFRTEINPELRDEGGRLLRGERQAFRLCLSCRTDGAKDERRDRRQDVHATS